MDNKTWFKELRDDIKVRRVVKELLKNDLIYADMESRVQDMPKADVVITLSRLEHGLLVDSETVNSGQKRCRSYRLNNNGIDWIIGDTTIAYEPKVPKLITI